MRYSTRVTTNYDHCENKGIRVIYDVGLKPQAYETRPTGGEGNYNPFQGMLFSKLPKNVYFRCLLLFTFIGEGLVVVSAFKALSGRGWGEGSV